MGAHTYGAFRTAFSVTGEHGRALDRLPLLGLSGQPGQRVQIFGSRARQLISYCR
jgi:hypothetical protein